MKRLLFIIFIFVATVNSCKKNSNSTPQHEDVLSLAQLQILDAAPLDTISRFTDMLFPDGSNMSNWSKINDPEYVYTFSKGNSISTASDKKALFIKRMTDAGIRLADDTHCSCYPTQPNGLAYVYGSKYITFTIINETSVCKEHLWGLDCSGLIYQMAIASSLNLPEGGTINYVMTSIWNTAFINSPDFQNLEMKDLFQIDPSQFEAGDIIVASGVHMGWVYSTSNTLGIINSQGSPDNTCVENSAVGRGPVLRADITTKRWIELLFPISGYHVLRVMQNGAPGLTTNIITSISQTSAVSGGKITNEGGSPITARGVCWSTTSDPTIANNKTINGAGVGIFSSSLTDLNPNTSYYVRAYATNSQGTGYGNQLIFTTTQNITTPTVITTAVTNSTSTSAIVGGNVTASGGGTVTERGVYWGTSQNPESTGTKFQIGSGIGPFSTSLSGLSPNTTYYVKAYATNSTGSAYGTQVSFTTSSGGQTGKVTDIEGNIYNTITIGTQVWMAENLKATKYNDGAAIPLVTDGTAWTALTSPSYCWYNNDATTYKATYGALYNWYAVNTGKLCPIGWHMPSDDEWTTLTNYLGGESVAGSKLKDTGTTYWLSPNPATNESGFTALPGGERSFNHGFLTIGNTGLWWSTTQFSNLFAWYRLLTSDSENVFRNYYNMGDGYSVRCLKDN